MFLVLYRRRSRTVLRSQGEVEDSPDVEFRPLVQYVRVVCETGTVSDRVVAQVLTSPARFPS
jgi:hypothetical protein